MVARYKYAGELRTIGQQLDKQGIDMFELRYQDGDYILQCGDPTPPYTDILHFRYTTFELRSMELSAAQARSAKFTLVNFESLGEILRTIGRKLEKLDAKLVCLSTLEAAVDGSRFKIEYESRDGRYLAEELVASNIADLATHMYKERAHLRGHSQNPSSAK